MSITAKDIQEQGFEHSRKGYDIEEVDVFLERVATDVDALTRQNQELRERVNDLQNQLANQPEQTIVMSDGGGALAEDQIREYESRIASYESHAAAYEGQIADLKEQLAKKGEDETAISAAIISAQKSADNIREEARLEGEKIYKEAENKAREIVRDALADKQTTLNELESLKKSRDSFREEYRKLLERFNAEAEDTFSGAPTKTTGPIDDDERAAEERAAIDEMRAATARSRQQTMDVDAEKTRTAYPAPAQATTSMPQVKQNIEDFGDTADDFDIEEID